MGCASNPFSLSGKTILVTGASSGIGRATAILCSQMGAQVVVTGRHEVRLQESFGDLRGEGHRQIPADLTDPESISRLVDNVPILDGVMHCAGIGFRKLSKSINKEDLVAVMDANFNSAVLLQSSLLAKKKVGKSASIIFVSSRAADVPSVANGIYSASKSALKSYAQCLALELAPRNIRVNCICPAIVRTPLWDPLINDGGITEDDLALTQSQYPLKRFGRPEDIANLAVFLLSDASSWMTGSSIDITGGSITL